MIKPLTNISTQAIIDCLLIAFKNYFVKMPDDLNYWEKRFKVSRLDKDLSFGYFDGDQLVAFILNGIGEFRGRQVAFNTGTGVVPAFRGQQLIDQIYAHAIPLLKAQGITHLALEVITKNDRAIRVYERIGFERRRQMLCFKGKLDHHQPRHYRLKASDYETIWNTFPDEHYYSWDHGQTGIQLAEGRYKAFILYQKETPLAHCILDVDTGYIAQIGTIDESEKYLMPLLHELGRITTEVKINNVWSDRKTLIAGLKKAGWENAIDQYEMWRKL